MLPVRNDNYTAAKQYLKRKIVNFPKQLQFVNQKRMNHRPKVGLHIT